MNAPQDREAPEDETAYEAVADDSDGPVGIEAERVPEPAPAFTVAEPGEAGGLTARIVRRNDPLFFFLIALAFSIGLTALPAGQQDLRLLLLWLAMAGYAVLFSLLTGETERVRETPENLAWGLTFALVLSGPLLVFGDRTLGAISQRLFGELRSSSLLALLIFVMPLAETLFFRAVLQERYVFWLTGLMASLWSILLLLPGLDITRFPAIGLVVALALLMTNLLYSYVRQRNGLAAAWFCQIAVNLVLIFLPFVASQGY